MQRLASAISFGAAVVVVSGSMIPAFADLKGRDGADHDEGKKAYRSNALLPQRRFAPIRLRP